MDAVKVLVEYKKSALAIVSSDGSVEGIVTESDIVRKVSATEHPNPMG